ncbi:hypothetical protein GCK32_021489 [Trichostrongylus colubriformis]|uniref:Uncharacterized protein n=1 Tax=Trichostrongylus colubriformis TaxID=6319 RepID=A0AAN8IHB8_TRICO
MESDPDYKSLLSKLERDYRIKINEFLEIHPVSNKITTTIDDMSYESPITMQHPSSKPHDRQKQLLSTNFHQ